MPILAPFSQLGASVAVTPGTNATSASTTLPGAGGHTLKVTNNAGVPISFATSQVAGGAVAVAAGVIVASGLTELFSIPDGTTDVAAWGIGAPTGSVYFQRGEGS